MDTSGAAELQPGGPEADVDDETGRGDGVYFGPEQGEHRGTEGETLQHREGNPLGPFPVQRFPLPGIRGKRGRERHPGIGRRHPDYQSYIKDVGTLMMVGKRACGRFSFWVDIKHPFRAKATYRKSCVSHVRCLYEKRRVYGNAGLTDRKD